MRASSVTPAEVFAPSVDMATVSPLLTKNVKSATVTARMFPGVFR